MTFSFDLPVGYVQDDRGEHFNWQSEGIPNIKSKLGKKPCSEATQAKLDKVLSLYSNEAVRSFKNFYGVSVRGFWTEYGARSFISKHNDKLLDIWRKK